MSLKQLPKIKAFEKPEGINWDPPSSALSRWADGPQAAEADEPNTISIYEVIGEDFWTGGGWTAKRMAGALRAIGKNDVTVNINSPGGDVFEGLAIFNLLAEHPAKVTVKVMGLAASAASIIAMAGDEVVMGQGSFLMIHNAWVMAMGNRHDLREAADVLEPIDGALADIYTNRTGLTEKEVAKMMDKETWINASDAVDQGFADRLSAEKLPESTSQARADITAKRRLEALLANQGLSRTERRALLRDATGMRDAASPDTPRAVEPEVAAALQSLLLTISPAR